MNNLFLTSVIGLLLSSFSACSTESNDTTETESFRGHIVDIENKVTYPGEIHVAESKITRIEKIDKIANDAPYYLPGFVDGHIHIESSMLTPVNFAQLAVTHGSVAVIADPHEIVNVLGEEGLDFMIDNASASKFNFYFGLPSCVPSSHLESSGAVIDVKATERLMQRPEICFLAEMMNYPGVVNDDPEVMAKIVAAKAVGKPIDGHAPSLLGADLEKYHNSGISTDHECSTMEEANQRFAIGMYVIVREGSSARNFEALWPTIANHPELTMLCSDDKHPDDLINGHIDEMVRRGLSKGVPVWNLLQAACVNPVKHYGIDCGQMQVGDKANFIAVDNLENMNVVQTVLDGMVVYDKKEGIYEKNLATDNPVPGVHPNNFKAEKITESDIALDLSGFSSANVIVAYDGSLTTGKENIPIASLSDDVQKIVVYNRYGNGKPQIAFIKGFNIQTGAIGATIAHDSHNIVAIGADDGNIVKAINTLIEMKGGITVVDGNEVSVMHLPIAGLMTDASGERVAEQYRQLIAKTRNLGCDFRSPFITMSFMALPVIPDLKLTDKGLVDVGLFDFVSVLK